VAISGDGEHIAIRAPGANYGDGYISYYSVTDLGRTFEKKFIQMKLLWKG